jgi:hypothetical protein
MARILPALLMVCCACAQGAAQQEQLQKEARALVRQFVGQLKPQLQQALQEGGPTRAIAVCANAAPTIADSLSESSGWQVRRVSLQQRNASRAVPDKWERAVLQQFDTSAAAGENPMDLHVGELQGTRYRYMQAQGVEAICLTCHGQNLSQPVIDALQQYYPDDMATGYQLGQVRGAISLSRQM